MNSFGKTTANGRVEDSRFVTGAGRYIADAVPENALKARVFRSPLPHADITKLDVSAARAMPGVHLVLTGEDLNAAGMTAGMHTVPVTNRDGTPSRHPFRPVLAQSTVRFVGEPIALIVADTDAIAQTASELIELDYEEREVKLDRSPGGPILHDEAPDNCPVDWHLGDPAGCDAAFAEAAHVVALEVEDSRIIVNSLEPRGCCADWRDGRLHFDYSGQGVWGPKGELARMLDLPEEAVHVTTPDVGGGFGMKAMMYPEYVAVSVASKLLNRPVAWISDRSDAMLGDHHGRDLVSDAALAFDKDYRLLGYKVHTRFNLGAYVSQFGALMQTQLFSRVLTGVYDIPVVYLRAEGILTNTTQVDAYRGAGRPEAIFLLERMMDAAAKELDVDPWELRRKNFIRADQFPYKTLVDETYDVGDFHRVLDAVEQTSDRAGFAARKQASAAQGKLRGMGLCYYIESILGDQSETAQIAFNADGTVTIFVGTQSNGQGHETVFAQFLSAQTGVPADRIRVVQGDSDLIPQGGGTGGSRSVTVQTTATLGAVEVMVAAFAPFLAEPMGVDPDTITFDGESFRAPGSNLSPSLLEAADMARAAGREDLLSHQARRTLDGRSFPNGAHVAEVEVDPDTGQVSLDRYTVVDDFGTLINPALAEGQVHGGIAQGAGQALMEHARYDSFGQPITGSFMDYAMPRAADFPAFGFSTEPVPSTMNPLGMKGCGEAGTVGAIAACTNAVADALWDRGVKVFDMPATPSRVWEYLKDATETAH